MDLPPFLGRSTALTPPAPPAASRPIPASPDPGPPPRIDLPFKRAINQHDVPAAARIDALSMDIPWSATKISETLKIGPVYGWVAMLDGRIVGYTIYEVHRTFLGIHRLAVDPDYRGRKVGPTLLDLVEGCVRPGRHKWVEAIVHEREDHGLLWLRNRGYRATGLVPGRFIERDDDGIHLWRDFSEI